MISTLTTLDSGHRILLIHSAHYARSGLSLVVAEATANGARIVSDTRVLYPSRPSAYKTGTLKTVVLRRDVVISFAGDVGIALGTIRAIARDLQDGVTAR